MRRHYRRARILKKYFFKSTRLLFEGGVFMLSASEILNQLKDKEQSFAAANYSKQEAKLDAEIQECEQGLRDLEAQVQGISVRMEALKKEFKDAGSDLEKAKNINAELKALKESRNSDPASLAQKLDYEQRLSCAQAEKIALQKAKADYAQQQVEKSLQLLTLFAKEAGASVSSPSIVSDMHYVRQGQSFLDYQRRMPASGQCALWVGELEAGKSWELTSQFVHNHPGVSLLDFSGRKFFKETWILLSKLLIRSGKISELILNHMQLGNEKGSYFVDQSPHIPFLLSLGLAGNDISNIGSAFYQLMISAPMLQALDLSDNPLDEETIKSIAVAIEHGSELLTLDLSQVPMTPDGLEGLAKALSSPDAKLQELKLRGCMKGPMLNSFIQKLSKKLSERSTKLKLQFMDLREADLDEETQRLLIALVKENPSLTQIHLDSISDGLRKQLDDNYKKVDNFHAAIRAGKLEEIKSLLYQGVLLEARLHDSRDTVAHTAVKANQLDVVKFLIGQQSGAQDSQFAKGLLIFQGINQGGIMPLACSGVSAEIKDLFIEENLDEKKRPLLSSVGAIELANQYGQKLDSSVLLDQEMKDFSLKIRQLLQPEQLKVIQTYALIYRLDRFFHLLGFLNKGLFFKLGYRDLLRYDHTEILPPFKPNEPRYLNGLEIRNLMMHAPSLLKPDQLACFVETARALAPACRELARIKQHGFVSKSYQEIPVESLPIVSLFGSLEKGDAPVFRKKALSFSLEQCLRDMKEIFQHLAQLYRLYQGSSHDREQVEDFISKFHENPQIMDCVLGLSMVLGQHFSDLRTIAYSNSKGKTNAIFGSGFYQAPAGVAQQKAWEVFDALKKVPLPGFFVTGAEVGSQESNEFLFQTIRRKIGHSFHPYHENLEGAQAKDYQAAEFQLIAGSQLLECLRIAHEFSQKYLSVLDLPAASASVSRTAMRGGRK